MVAERLVHGQEIDGSNPFVPHSFALQINALTSGLPVIQQHGGKCVLLLRKQSLAEHGNLQQFSNETGAALPLFVTDMHDSRHSTDPQLRLARRVKTGTDAHCGLESMREGVPLVSFAQENSATRRIEPHGVAPTAGNGGFAAIPHGKIDELVFARLSKCGIEPARICTNEVFLRRVYLDATGTLPTAQQASFFLDDSHVNKRAALIDSLLQSEEFACYWAMKWSDLLRIKAEFPINLWPTAAQEYYHWVLDSLRENKPYNQFARELLTANGSNFRAGPANFYRAVQNREPQSLAQAVALTFMGVRAEKWPAARLSQMAVFFSQVGYKPTGEWKEEIVFYDRGKPLASGNAVSPDGTPAQLPPGTDPRVVFADWLTGGENPWFARNIVNRVWAWLLGRGIVQEPDDIRPDNPPSQPELLSFLEAELVTSGFDLKHIFRLVLNSSVYQLKSLPRSANPDAEKLFAYYPVRRLDAEVLIDAICQITGTAEQYSSAVPEPYTIMPDGQRAVALPDGSISSSFLELFGRSPRDTGLESERNNRPSAAQRLHVLNSSHIERKIEQGPGLQEVFRASDLHAMATSLYLTILSRYPNEAELKVVDNYAKSSGVNRRQVGIDLAWALINSTEFLYRH